MADNYTPHQALKEAIDRIEKTNTFNPMEATNLLVQARCVLTELAQAKADLAKANDWKSRLLALWPAKKRRIQGTERMLTKVLVENRENLARAERAEAELAISRDAHNRQYQQTCEFSRKWYESEALAKDQKRRIAELEDRGRKVLKVGRGLPSSELQGALDNLESSILYPAFPSALTPEPAKEDGNNG